MNSPHTIATLLYCFNERDEVLLMERAQEPNLGVWSPPGGKLHLDAGESPHQCASREAAEELGIIVPPRDLHLAGIVNEEHFSGLGHWLMFLFEMKWKLRATPPPHREGRFEFFPRADLERLTIPTTDREQIWPLFWKHRGGFFAAHHRILPAGSSEWTIEETQDGTTDH